MTGRYTRARQQTALDLKPFATIMVVSAATGAVFSFASLQSLTNSKGGGIENAVLDFVAFLVVLGIIILGLLAVSVWGFVYSGRKVKKNERVSYVLLAFAPLIAAIFIMVNMMSTNVGSRSNGDAKRYEQTNICQELQGIQLATSHRDRVSQMCRDFQLTPRELNELKQIRALYR